MKSPRRSERGQMKVDLQIGKAHMFDVELEDAMYLATMIIRWYHGEQRGLGGRSEVRITDAAAKESARG
jgi:hypothetical protein